MSRTKLAKSKKKKLHAIFQLDTEPKTAQQAIQETKNINMVPIISNLSLY